MQYVEFVINFKIVNDLSKETSLRVSCIFEKFSFHFASEHYEMDEYNYEDLSGQHLTTPSFCENLFDETLLRSFKNILNSKIIYFSNNKIKKHLIRIFFIIFIGYSFYSK